MRATHNAERLSRAAARLVWSLLVVMAVTIDWASATQPAATMTQAELRAAPAVLVMVQDPGCPYCARWEADVGRSYRASEEGKFAPLAVYLRGDSRIADLEKIVYSPTFVLLAHGREVGRIIGYQGSDLFWMQLGPLIAKARAAAGPTIRK